MKKIIFISTLLFAFVFAGCSYDDDALWNKVDELDDRVTAVEQKIATMDQNINTLQQILNNQLRITGVEDNSDGSVTVKLLSPSGVATNLVIKRGQQAETSRANEDASAEGNTCPEISVALGADGIYYWTVNGEFVLDQNGNRLPVTGKDGANGKDGVTPAFKIENGMWYVSFDNGLSWIVCGKATGDDGDSFFSDATLSDDGKICYLTLVDGTVLPIEVYREFNIAFDLAKQFISYGATLEVPFTIIGGDENSSVEVIGQNGFEASVKMQKSAGTISVTAPMTTLSGKVIVLVSDGADKVIMRTLTFVTGQLSTSTTSVEVAKAGGTVSVEVTTDLEYTASFDADCTWARLAAASRGELRTETISVIVDANPDPDARQTYLTLYSDGTPIETILIVQKGSEYSADRLVFLVQPEQELETMIGMVQLPIYTSSGEMHIDWGDGTVETVASSLTNTTNRRRAFAHTYADCSKEYEVQVWGGTVTALNRNMGSVLNASGTSLYGVCDSTLTAVLQWGNAGTLTAVNLGANNLRRVNVPDPNAFKKVTSLDFKISYIGQGAQLTSIPQGFLDGAVALKSAASMFYHCYWLKEVPEDLFKNCAQITNISQVFSDCWELQRGVDFSNLNSLTTISQVYYNCKSLKWIPAHSFPEKLNNAGPTVHSLFCGCESLEEIPEGTFDWADNAKSANLTTFNSMFKDCKKLKKVDLSFLNKVPKAYGFSNTFQNCENLEAEIPAYALTLEDGTIVNVKLWERFYDEYKSYFANRTASSTDCFSGALKIVGYEAIPTSWGGPWDGTGGNASVQITAAPLQGHAYYTIDFKVKSQNIVKLKYFLASKSMMDYALKYYNNNYETLVTEEGDSIDSRFYSDQAIIAQLNSEDGYTFRFSGGQPEREYAMAVVGYNYLGNAVDAVAVKTEAMPKGSDAYESYVGRWRVTSAASISDYIEYEPRPISFEVTIEPYRVDSMYAVTGWGVTDLNDSKHHIAFHFEPEKGNVLTTYRGAKMTMNDWYTSLVHEDPLNNKFSEWSVGTGFYADYSENGIGLLSSGSSAEQTMQAKDDGQDGKFVVDGVMSEYQGAWAIKYIGFDFLLGMGSYSTSWQFFPRLLVKPEYAQYAYYKDEQHFPLVVGPFTFELVDREVPNTIFKAPAKAPSNILDKSQIKGITLPVGNAAQSANGRTFPKADNKVNIVDTRR